MEKKQKIWIGSPPTRCDCCNQEIVDTFIDGMSIKKCWAFMCVKCFLTYGVGIKKGCGQAYVKSGEVWKKVVMQDVIVV